VVVEFALSEKSRLVSHFSRGFGRFPTPYCLPETKICQKYVPFMDEYVVGFEVAMSRLSQFGQSETHMCHLTECLNDVDKRAQR
jgi:hypothetical protein